MFFLCKKINIFFNLYKLKKMDTDDYILLLVVIFAILFVKKVKENFDFKRRVDGVSILSSKTVVDTPIMTNEVVIDGVPIRNDTGQRVNISNILPSITYNKTEGIIPDPNTYNISTNLPPGVNEATLFSNPTKHIRIRRYDDLLKELTGES
jgi:hypothetical protein